MKIGGRVLFLVLFGASAAHAQAAPGSAATPPPPPPSNGAFAPASPAPEPVPAPPSVDPAPEPAAPVPAPSKEPRPARVIAAPSSSEPTPEEPLPPSDDDTSKSRGSFVHDGFYLRLGLGAGYVSGKSENDSTISGWGVAPDVWIGGSPVPGLAIGVTFNGVSVANPHVEISSADRGGAGAASGDANGVLTYSVFGLFGDFYPDPKSGLHFMAGLNYSVLKFTLDNGAESTPASGVGLLGGIGYEWWVGREWSIGPLARLHWASVSDSGGTTSVLSPVFLLGFTYH